MASSESQARLTQAEPAKWIVVYKNGDQHFAGRRMVVKPREIKTFDHLLEEVTVKLSPSFGAVRNIFTPEGGTRVSSLTDLKPNGKYVASPNEPFRQLSRTKYGELPVQSNSSSQSHVSLQPLKDKPKNVDSSGARRSQHAVPSRYREAADGELTIHVYRNGDAFSPAVPLRVDRLARTHWQQTLTRLGDKLKIGRGVHKLYNLKGQLVRDPAADLEHNGLYVAAADNEGFRLVNYGTAREPFKSVTRGDSRSSTPHLPCPHQRIAESAPSVCAAADSQAGRVAATPSTSSSPPRRAPLPPLRLSYPELAHRYSQLKDKCAQRALHRDEQKATASPAQQEATRKYHSLHHHYHRPHVQPKALRPPPRRVEVAPIDLVPAEAAPTAVESDGPFSSSSSNTDVDDGSMMGITYPELSQPDLDTPRPEPFYLHPLPESGEADSTGRHRSRSSESDKMERLLGSALTSPAGEQWHDDRHEPEPDGYIVTEPPEPAEEIARDLSASHSAPHLSRPASRTDSREATTPRPSDPNILTLPQPRRRQPRGTGFYSPGYSPLPEPRRVSRAGTPRTPAPSPVTVRDPGGGRLAVGDGSSVSSRAASRASSRAPSRPASRAASEPRLDSALGGDGSQCEIELVEDEDGELRCVSVLSRASSVPELPSPGTPEFAPVVMDRLAPRATLRAPVSRGESPARSGRTSPASARSEDGGSVTPRAGVDGASTMSSPSERSLLMAGRDSMSSETVTEEVTSPDVIFENHISPAIDVASPHPPSTCEDVLSTGYDEGTSEQQPHSAGSRDSNKLTASCRQSPVTPEMRRPLLSYPVYRDLVMPGREPSILSGDRKAEAAPVTAQSLPGVVLERSAPKLSPKAMSVDQMPRLATSFTQTPVVETPKKQVQAVATQSSPPPPAAPSPVASSPEAPVNERWESPIESQSSLERRDSAESRASRTTKPLSSSPRASPEKQPEMSPPSSAERGDRASNPMSSTTESRRSAQPAASIAEIDHQRTPPSAAVANPAEPRPPPLPSPRRRRSASESSPLSAPGTAAGSSGWVWDEVPARPSDRAALAAQPVPSPPQAPPAPPAVAEEATSGSGNELLEPEREDSPGEPQEDVGGSHDESPSPPELPGLQEELQKLADQPVWPPTRTNSPEQTSGSSPQLAEGSDSPKVAPEPAADAESPVPRSATATLSGQKADPAAPAAEPAVPAAARGTEAAPATGRGPEAAPADIGQKLDEIASLLRTLLLQNMTARQAADGGSGAAPPLAGLTEEQLRALLLKPGKAERAGDSPPHKPR